MHNADFFSHYNLIENDQTIYENYKRTTYVYFHGKVLTDFKTVAHMKFLEDSIRDIQSLKKKMTSLLSPMICALFDIKGIYSFAYFCHKQHEIINLVMDSLDHKK